MQPCIAILSLHNFMININFGQQLLLLDNVCCYYRDSPKVSLPTIIAGQYTNRLFKFHNKVKTVRWNIIVQYIYMLTLSYIKHQQIFGEPWNQQQLYNNAVRIMSQAFSSCRIVCIEIQAPSKLQKDKTTTKTLFYGSNRRG